MYIDCLPYLVIIYCCATLAMCVCVACCFYFLAFFASALVLPHQNNWICQQKMKAFHKSLKRACLSWNVNYMTTWYTSDRDSWHTIFQFTGFSLHLYFSFVSFLTICGVLCVYFPCHDVDLFLSTPAYPAAMRLSPASIRFVHWL